MRAPCTGSITQSAAPRNQTKKRHPTGCLLVASSREAKKSKTAVGGLFLWLLTGFVPSPLPIARKGECEGGTFAGFPPSRSVTRPQATTFAQQKCRTSKKETSFWMSLFCWCERWDLNPHDLTDTSTSSLPVCRFQHARERNFRYYNKIPLFVKRQSEKLPRNRFHHFRGKEKTLEALWLQGFSCWCARRDLNPHARNEH